MSPKHWIFCGALLAALGVAAGAFGAHGLKGKDGAEGILNSAQLETFEVAVRYQMYHAMALVLVGFGSQLQPRKCWRFAGGAFLFGMLAFSGSLYAWLFTQQKWLVMVVPLGGAAFIVGWVAMAVGALRSPCATRDIA